MRPALRSALTTFSLVLAMLASQLPAPALAENTTHNIGAFALELDSQTWRMANAGPAHWLLERFDRKQPAFVSLRLVDVAAGTTCGQMAKAELPMEKFYDPVETIVTVGGVSASLVVAKSGCRSLSPRGQVLCIPNAGTNGGKAYLVTQTYARCGFRGVAFEDEEDFAAFLAAIKPAPPH